MAIFFIEGFDHLSAAQLSRKWSVAQNGTVNTGRFGGQCFKTTGANDYVEKVAPSASQGWRLGFAFRLDTHNTSATVPFVALMDGGSAQVELCVDTGRRLQVTRNGTAVGSPSTGTINFGQWYYIEWFVVISNGLTADQCNVYVDGTQYLALGSGDTQNTANATADRFRLQNFTGFHGVSFDDVFASLESSTLPTLIGDTRVVTLSPSGNGNSSQFVGSDGNSTDNYLLVDETGSIDDADYVQSSNVGDKDTYAMGNLTVTATAIHAVQLSLGATKDDAGARTARGLVRISGTDYESSDLTVSSSNTVLTPIWLTSPATSSAWTQSEVDGMEAGVKVQA